MIWLAAWVVLPVLATAVALGWGVLAERAAGYALPGLLVAPVGLAAVVVVTQATTATDLTAEATVPVTLAGALAGLYLARGRVRELISDRWLLAAAAAVYLVLGAAGMLAFKPTFAGYGVLGDTAIQFIGVDHLMTEGRSTAGLPGSSYKAALDGYFAAGYPSGLHTPLGALRATLQLDVAWAYMPYLAWVLAVASLALAHLASFVVPGRVARAAAGFVAVVPALVMGYVLQGSIKEVGTVFSLALIAGLLPVFRDAPRGWRRGIPLALATAAAIAIISISVAPWLGPFLLVALALALRAGGRWTLRPALVEAAVFAVLAVVLSVPQLSQLFSFVEVAQGVVTNQNEIGNLLGPLDSWQAFPVWPSGDYRLTPPGMDALVAIGLAVAATFVGFATVLRRPGAHWPVLAFLAVNAIAWVYVTRNGSPWADAKAHMIVSPALALCAALGVLSLLERTSTRRLEGAVLAVVLVGGIAWTDALQYHDASLAPSARLRELADIGDDLEGRGPTLYPQYEEYAKHFLRRGDPESPTEPWRTRYEEPVIANGGGVGLEASNDIDQLAWEYVRQYRTLVIRRSAASSRPPSVYRPIRRGKYFEVWQRAAELDPALVTHIPVQPGPLQPSGRPPCDELRRRAREGTRLRYSSRPSATGFTPAEQPLPTGWAVDPQNPNAVVSVGAGAIGGDMELAQGGAYDVFLEGSIGRRVEVRLDGRLVGTVQDELQGRRLSVEVGRANVGPGTVSVDIRRGGGGPGPGDGGTNRTIGMLTLVRVGGEEGSIREVPASDARKLCREDVDWVEVWR